MPQAARPQSRAASSRAAATANGAAGQAETSKPRAAPPRIPSLSHPHHPTILVGPRAGAASWALASDPLAGGGGLGMSQQMGRGGYGYGELRLRQATATRAARWWRSRRCSGAARRSAASSRTKVRQRGREGHGTAGGRHARRLRRLRRLQQDSRSRSPGCARSRARRRGSFSRTSGRRTSTRRRRRRSARRSAAAQPKRTRPTRPTHLPRQAGGRPPFEANPGAANPFEVGALVEVDAKGDGKLAARDGLQVGGEPFLRLPWRQGAARVHGQLEAPRRRRRRGADGDEAAARRRATEPQLPSTRRVCCAHKEPPHPLAGSGRRSPLFCDRCRALLQQSNQAVYLQEATPACPRARAGSWCSTCFNHLRVTRQRDRAAFQNRTCRSAARVHRTPAAPPRPEPAERRRAPAGGARREVRRSADVERGPGEVVPVRQVPHVVPLGVRALRRLAARRGGRSTASVRGPRARDRGGQGAPRAQRRVDAAATPMGAFLEAAR